MGIGNIVLLFQVTAYVLTCIFSFFVFAPMATNKNGDFNGSCLLHAQVQVDDVIGHSEIIVLFWGPAASCNFAITIGVICMLVATVQLVRLSFHVFYETDSSFLATFLTLVVNIIVTVMLLASAIDVTKGYSVWCQQIDEAGSCSVAGFIEDLWVRVPGINPEHYALQMGMVQFGLWAEFIVWFILCLLSGVKLVKYSQREPLVRSLARERQRLIGQYNQPDA